MNWHMIAPMVCYLIGYFEGKNMDTDNRFVWWGCLALVWFISCFTM